MLSYGTSSIVIQLLVSESNVSSSRQLHYFLKGQKTNSQLDEAFNGNVIGQLGHKWYWFCMQVQQAGG